MKKIIFVKILLSFFVLFLYFPPTVLAAVDCKVEANKNRPECTTSSTNTCIASQANDYCLGSTPGTTISTTNTSGETLSTQQQSVQKDAKCSGLSFFTNIGECLSLTIITLLETILVKPASWFMMAGGYFLDTVLKVTILDFHKLVGVVDPKNPSTGIYGIWVFIKSIINVIIVFELLFLAIQMILGKGGFVWKDRLIQVLVFAVFTNFSFYFTKVLIDISNITTMQVYGALLGDKKSVSDAMMAILQPQETFNSFSKGGSILEPLLKAAFILVIASTFIKIALIYLTRAITFFLLLVLSPLMFASYAGVGALSTIKKWGEDWWKTFNNQLLIGPLTMLMLYLSLRLMSSDVLSLIFRPNTPPVAGLNNLTQGDLDFIASTAYVVLKYAAYFALLSASLRIAQKFSDSYSDSVRNMVSKGFGKVAGGAVGTIGRQVVGRFSKGGSAAWGESLRNGAAKGGVAGFTSRMALKTLDAGQNSSFDFRNSKDGLLNKGLAKMGVKNTDFGAGSGKGGISQLIKDSEDSKLKKQILQKCLQTQLKIKKRKEKQTPSTWREKPPFLQLKQSNLVQL